MRLFPALLALGLAVCAQDRSKVLAEYTEFLAIPNVASDLPNIQKNADWIKAALEKRGVSTRLLSIPGKPPVVFGELNAPGAKRTVVFYAHYDGQPVDPRQWTGSAPWEPSLRGSPASDPETRIYGRSTSDDKAPIQAMLSALDVMKERGQKPAINIKFVFEGQEEAGSEDLGEILRLNKGLLESDYWLICDGPVHQSRRQQLYFGARGVVGLDVTVYGASRELHSGHYGNWAPNAAMLLAELLASMRNKDGRVAITGFYDSIAPLTQTERDALAAAPDIEASMKKELKLAKAEHYSLLGSVNEPSLNIRGLSSAAVGKESRNVVPNVATASIDIRLVKGNTAQEMVEKLKEHVRRQGYFVTDKPPTDQERLNHPRIAEITVGDSGYNAVRTSMDLPASKEVIAAVRAWRPDTVVFPTLGGSVPLEIMAKVVNVPLIGVPIVNHDNSQHTHNENLRLQNLWDGIELMTVLFRMGAPAN